MDTRTDQGLIEHFGDELPQIVKNAQVKIEALQDEHKSLSRALTELQRKKAHDSTRAQELQAQQLELMAGHLLGQAEDEEAFRDAVLSLQREREVSHLWVTKAADLQKHLEGLQGSISAKISRARRPLQDLRSYEELKGEIRQRPLRSDTAQHNVNYHVEALGLEANCEHFLAEVGAA